MLFYNPTNCECLTEQVDYKPRTCFLMTKLGDGVSKELSAVRKQLESSLDEYGFRLVDAESRVTGRDFLEKIWRMILEVPVGIVIIDSDMSEKTYANIFYELGIMQAYGKETLVIKTMEAAIPSDFLRTEYIPFNESFESRIEKYLKNLEQLAEYYEKLADQLEKNPLLSLDYMRRAYLLSGDSSIRERARETLTELRLSERAKNSVEMLHASFCSEP